MFLSSTKRKKNRTRLSVETFNDRIVPAVVFTQLDLDGDGATDDIRIVGDGQNSKITITDNGANQVQIQIDANGDGDYNDAGKGDLSNTFNFSADSMVLEAQLKGGKDSFDYIVANNTSASARTVVVDLGSGNDSFNWNTSANDVLNLSRISIDVTAGSGADTINVSFDEVRKSQISVKVDAGAGNDKYDVKFDRIDDGASVDMHTELGAGLNIHNADINEVGFGDKGTLDMVIVGGNQKDTVELRMHDDIGDGTKASRFSAVIDLLGGNDIFKALFDATGNVFRVDDHSQASFVVRGGAGHDTILAGQNGTGTIRIDPDALLSINLDGGVGHDNVVADFGSANLWELIGMLQIRMDGGIGNDTMTCLLANNSNSTGTYDVAVRGGAGNDTMTFNLVNTNGTPTYGPANGAVLDGGTGTDSLTNSNPAVGKLAAFETVI